jgi:hypothetical protein
MDTMSTHLICLPKLLQNPETHKITDYFSFYTLSSTIINNKKHNLLEAVYLFYYATEIAFKAGVETNGRLRKRVHEIIADALVVADQAKFDVFNAMTLMDNVPVLTDLKVCLSRSFSPSLRSHELDIVWSWGRSPQLLSVQLENSRPGRREGLGRCASW